MEFSLVSSKYNSTLAENKIIYMALTRIDLENNVKTVNIFTKEICNVLKNESNIYRTLFDMTKRLIDHPIIINNKITPLITNILYNKGMLTIKFNDNIPDNILKNMQNFSIDKFIYIMDFNNLASLKMYEFLYYHLQLEHVFIDYYKFSFILGIANIGKIGDIENIDFYNKYLNLNENDKKYKDWYDLKRYFLKVAYDEFNLKSDFLFTYSNVPIKKNKTKTIEFNIIDKNKINVNTEQPKKEEDVLLKQIWAKTKREDEYFDFLYELEIQGIDTNTLEDKYTKDELLKMYKKWKNEYKKEP